MNYWRINTDSDAIPEKRTCDLWYAFGAAFAGDIEGAELKHAAVFRKLSPGDGIFMHHNKLGVVGYGVVQEMWNCKIYTGTDRRLYETEPCEYSVQVKWDPACDCREDPLAISGRLPYMGAYSYVNPEKWDIKSVLEKLRGLASP